MVNTLKFIVSLAVAIVVMLVIRAYAFTICTVATDNMQPELRRGDKVFVNRLNASHAGRGDMVVYGDSALSISTIAAVAGDTITMGGEQYVIESHCRGECSCGECRTYLLASGSDSVFVDGSQIRGRAYPLRLRLFGR